MKVKLNSFTRPPSVLQFFTIVAALGIQFLFSQVTRTAWREWPLPELFLVKHIVPKYIATNHFKDIYLLDDENYWLLAIPADGGQPFIAGGWGDSGEMFVLPSDLVASPGLDVIVCDNASHRILRFDRKLNFIADLSLAEMIPFPVEFPYRIATNQLGEIIVANSGDWEVSLISPEGKYVTTIGDVSYGVDRFAEIADLALGKDNRFGLIDAGRDLFLELTREGQVLRKALLPEAGIHAAQWWQDRWLILSARGTLYELSPETGLFSEVPSPTSSTRPLQITDFALVGNIIYAVDGLSGTVLDAELKIRE